MIKWKVQKPGRLLNEIKSKLSDDYTPKDLRWSLEHNRCFVNHRLERFGSTVVQRGDLICLQVEKRPRFQIEKSRFLYEDSDLLVYDKPPLLSSEDLGKLSKTLLVHRLDRDTSGLILLAKTTETQNKLEKLFRLREIEKEYLALVEGSPQEKGIISGKMTPLRKWEGGVIWGMGTRGLSSETHWNRLDFIGKNALLSCHPLTGRTHQIRLHLAHIGHPIVGDYVYGLSQKKIEVFRPLLHAHRLSFYHPLSKEKLTLTSPLPPDFFEKR